MTKIEIAPLSCVFLCFIATYRNQLLNTLWFICKPIRNRGLSLKRRIFQNARFQGASVLSTELLPGQQEVGFQLTRSGDGFY